MEVFFINPATTYIVAGLIIEQETGIRVPMRTVGKYLKRWEFTPQKPIKRA